MRIAIIGQEEPIYFGPFLRHVIESRHKDVVAVVIAGSRGAGSHPKTFRQKLENIYMLWLIMEPFGFLRNTWLRLWQRCIKLLGSLGASLDRRSIKGVAEKYSIPVIYTQDINSIDFLRNLSQFAPDIIINQTELLLKEEILGVPRIGVINRHASLLPHFRGRLASWWAHAQEPPEHGVSIHFVDKDIDSGPIIVQRKFNIDPRVSYTRVLDILFEESGKLILEALEKLEQPNFSTISNDYKGTQTYLFPTLQDVKAYKEILRKRRERTE